MQGKNIQSLKRIDSNESYKDIREQRLISEAKPELNSSSINFRSKISEDYLKSKDQKSRLDLTLSKRYSIDGLAMNREERKNGRNFHGVAPSFIQVGALEICKSKDVQSEKGRHLQNFRQSNIEESPDDQSKNSSKTTPGISENSKSVQTLQNKILVPVPQNFSETVQKNLKIKPPLLR